MAVETSCASSVRIRLWLKNCHIEENMCRLSSSISDSVGDEIREEVVVANCVVWDGSGGAVEVVKAEEVFEPADEVINGVDDRVGGPQLGGDKRDTSVLGLGGIMSSETETGTVSSPKSITKDCSISRLWSSDERLSDMFGGESENQLNIKGFEGQSYRVKVRESE